MDIRFLSMIQFHYGVIANILLEIKAENIFFSTATFSPSSIQNHFKGQEIHHYTVAASVESVDVLRGDVIEPRT